MTKNEVKLLVNIFYTADGECYYCAVDLVKRFGKAFPEFSKYAMDYFLKTFYPDKHAKEEPNDNDLRS